MRFYRRRRALPRPNARTPKRKQASAASAFSSVSVAGQRRAPQSVPGGLGRRGRSGCERYGAVVVNWKKALVVALVVLLVLIGIPILMPGMSGAMCADCGPAIAVGEACSLLAVFAGLALALTVLAVRLRTRRDLLGDLLRSLELERPPQLA